MPNWEPAWCYPTAARDTQPSPLLLFSATSRSQSWVSSQHHPLAQGHHPAPAFKQVANLGALSGISTPLWVLHPEALQQRGGPIPEHLLEGCRCCRLGGCRVSRGVSLTQCRLPKCCVPQLLGTCSLNTLIAGELGSQSLFSAV